MTSALSPVGDSFPLVVYATGTLYKVTPDSSVNDGMMAISWSRISFENGFSGCDVILSTGFSRWSSRTWGGTTDGICIWEQSQRWRRT